MQSEIEKVEISLEVARQQVEIGKTALRLAENKDFQFIILNGYFKDEASRLTGLLGDPQAKEQEAIMSDLHAIASLQRYLRRLVQFGDMMEKEIQDHLQTLDELRSEA